MKKSTQLKLPGVRSWKSGVRSWKRGPAIAYLLSSIFYLLSSSLSAQAALHIFDFNGGFQNGGNVPDGGGAIGWSDMRALSGIAEHSITDVSVTLNVSGGYNGDLYAYLSYNNVLVSLLNRVGVDSTGPAGGYADSGFNIRLSDTGALGDIHRYQQVSGYQARISDGSSWQPDGRTTPPNVVPQSFDGAERIGFSSYQDMNPNGTWTLFISDWSGGDSSLSQVVSWSLEITAVPEPINLALGLFAAWFAAVSLARWWRARTEGSASCPNSQRARSRRPACRRLGAEVARKTSSCHACSGPLRFGTNRDPTATWKDSHSEIDATWQCELISAAQAPMERRALLFSGKTP